MKCKKLACAVGLIEKRNNFLQKYISPILLLSLRFLVASIFLKSGLIKFHSFDSTIYLFENEYKVPLLEPVFAAYLTTIFELLCSSLLIIGLATRPASGILFIMTAVIQFVVMPNPEHIFWFAVLATIIVFGPGVLSLDAFVKKMAKKCADKK